MQWRPKVHRVGYVSAWECRPGGRFREPDTDPESIIWSWFLLQDIQAHIQRFRCSTTTSQDIYPRILKQTPAADCFQERWQNDWSISSSMCGPSNSIHNSLQLQDFTSFTFIFFVAGTGHSWIHQTDSDSDKWQMTHYTDYTTHWQTHISHHWVTMPLRTSFSSMTMTLPWWKNWIDVDQFVLEQISPRSRRRIRRRTPLVTKVQPRRKRKTRANGKLHTKNWQRNVPRLIRSWFSVDFNFMSDWLQLHLVSYWVVDDNSMTDWYVLILILLYYIISKFPSVITHQHWCHIVLSPSQISFGLCQILGGIQWPLTVPDELSKSEWFSTLNAREREANWVSFYFLTFHFNNFDFDLNFQFTGEWHVMILMWVT